MVVVIYIIIIVCLSRVIVYIYYVSFTAITMNGQSERIEPPRKRQRRQSSQETVTVNHAESEYGHLWADWPAPQTAMVEARNFIMDM
jgi:hypothetical protein